MRCLLNIFVAGRISTEDYDIPTFLFVGRVLMFHAKSLITSKERKGGPIFGGNMVGDGHGTQH